LGNLAGITEIDLHKMLNAQHSSSCMKPSLLSYANLLFSSEFITPPTGLNMKLNSEVS
jgi:hypothetical protein